LQNTEALQVSCGRPLKGQEIPRICLFALEEVKKIAFPQESRGTEAMANQNTEASIVPLMEG